MAKGNYVRTKEIREKNSIANKRLYSDKVSHPRLGKKHSVETKKKIGLSNSGENSGWYGKKHTLAWRKHMSKTYSGENCPNWRGGITSKQMKIRNSIEYRLWRESIFARDNWICQECNKQGGKLHAHHIKSFSSNPELRVAIDNGITLCVKCHSKKEGHKMLRYKVAT